MSADNWSECPNCNAIAGAARAALREQVRESYGKIPVDEFDALRERASEPLGLKPTFREDYEIWGAENGLVYVSYSGRCEVCGVSLQFEHEHEIEGVAASGDAAKETP